MFGSWSLAYSVDVAAEVKASAEGLKPGAPEVSVSVPASLEKGLNKQVGLASETEKKGLEGDPMEENEIDQDDTTYLLKVARSKSHLLATSLSDYTVCVYALQQQQQQFTQRLCCITGHTGPVTDLLFPFGDAPNLLMTASEDGSIKSWDLSNPSHPTCLSTLVCDGRRSAVWSISVSVSGQLLAASSQHGVVIWRRVAAAAGHGGLKWKKCLSLEESFCDEVTQVLFHPYFSSASLKASNEPLLLAACGEDGLVCLFDLNKGGDEDDNCVGVLNAESSIAQMGFFGANPEKCSFLWCRTNDETFRVWNWEEAFAVGASLGDGDVMMEEAEHHNNKSKEVCELLDARKTLTESLAKQPALSFSFGASNTNNDNNCAKPSKKERRVDYLIDCFWDSVTSELRLVCGSALGDVYYFQVAVQTGLGTIAFLPGREKVQLKGILPNGHSAVVRSIEHSDVSSYITCGEDGKLCLWSPGANNHSPLHMHKTNQVRANKTSMSRRFKPY